MFYVSSESSELDVSYFELKRFRYSEVFFTCTVVVHVPSYFCFGVEDILFRQEYGYKAIGS